MTRFLVVVLLPVLIVLASPTGAAGASRTDAEAFIQGLADKVVAALTAPDTTRDQRETRFRALLNEHFAVGDIGRFVLGRHWRALSPNERDEYLRLFEEMIVATYLDRFDRYSGETLSVIRSVAADPPGDVIVHSEIRRAQGGEPLAVGWRVRGYGDRLKIVDVIIAGVGMSETQRSEFGSVMRRHGGRVDGLFEEMRRFIENRL